jgi:hypothetical protein
MRQRLLVASSVSGALLAACGDAASVGAIDASVAPDFSRADLFEPGPGGVVRCATIEDEALALELASPNDGLVEQQMMHGFARPGGGARASEESTDRRALFRFRGADRAGGARRAWRRLSRLRARRRVRC